MDKRLILAGLAVCLLVPPLAQAMTIHCGAGDVSCLIAAMNTANTHGHANRIILEAGTYLLTAVDHDDEGPMGLPTVFGTLTIQGAGMGQTVLQRDPTAPPFRFFLIDSAGRLRLRGLTVTGGLVIDTSGAGALNFGTLQLHDTEFSNHVGRSTGGLVFGVAIRNQLGHVQMWQSRLAQNRCDTDGVSTGGLFNEGGAVEIAQSAIVENVERFAGAALFNNVHNTETAQMTLINSEISSNTGGIAGGIINNGALTLHHVSLRENHGRNSGALLNGGTLMITRSTIAHNVAEPLALGDTTAGALWNGTDASLVTTITDSTIAENSAIPLDVATMISGGILHEGGDLGLRNVTLAGNIGRDAGGVYTLGTFSLENTILAENAGGNCRGNAVSVGYNLLDELQGCQITLQPTDHLGDAGLGVYVEGAQPGTGVVPLTPQSPAINAGNPATCSQLDQIFQRRVGVCDIGAVEFQGEAVSRE